jgi:hypothetical protein
MRGGSDLSFVFAALELPESALFSLRKLRRSLPSVLWFDPLDDRDLLAPFQRSWSDEWGYLPLAKAALDETGVERFDVALQDIRLPPAVFRISRLTFILDPEPVRIAARVDISPSLSRLVQASEAAVSKAGGEVQRFEPLIPLANCFGATREELTAYSDEVEPFKPIEVSCDRFLMCSRAPARSMDSLQLRLKVDYEYALR